MTTLRVELEVRDYDLWRAAFDGDAAGRQRHGARRYRIFRPVGDDHRVMLDVDFDSATHADAFLTVMREQVWPSADKAPAKVGVPTTSIIEMVESREYT